MRSLARLWENKDQQVNAAIAAAETQYQNELKTAQDKLAATKAMWLSKLNG